MTISLNNEMNRLVSKGTSNTYLKVPFEKNWRFQNSDFLSLLRNFRSSRPEVFCQKFVLRNFTKFTGKHMCQVLRPGLRPATLLKKRLWHRCFTVNFVKFLRTPFFKEHLWWMLLKFLSR